MGLIIILQFPGTVVNGVNPLSSPIVASDYEAHFNSSEILGDTSWNPLGDVWTAYNYIQSTFRYLIDGFPTMLDWIRDSYITDPSGVTVFNVFAWVLRGIYALLMITFFIEFISGRIFSD